MLRTTLFSQAAIALCLAVTLAACSKTPDAELPPEVSSNHMRLQHGTRVTVFGPEVVTRGRGKPTAEVFSFALPPTAIGPFTLIVESDGISSATIELNGAEAFGPQDFNKNVAELRTEFVPTETNQLSVLLEGKPGSSLTLRVEATETHSDDADGDSFPDTEELELGTDPLDPDSTPSGFLVRTSHGVAGGTFAAPDGSFTVTIPEGAVTEPTSLAFYQMASNDSDLARYDATFGNSLTSRGFRMLPSGTEFATPITVEFTIAAQEQAIAFFDLGDGTTYTPLGSTELAAGDNDVQIPVAHFSDLFSGVLKGAALSVLANLVQESDGRLSGLYAEHWRSPSRPPQGTTREEHASDTAALLTALNDVYGTIPDEVYAEFHAFYSSVVKVLKGLDLFGYKKASGSADVLRDWLNGTGKHAGVVVLPNADFIGDEYLQGAITNYHLGLQNDLGSFFEHACFTEDERQWDGSDIVDAYGIIDTQVDTQQNSYGYLNLVSLVPVGGAYRGLFTDPSETERAIDLAITWQMSDFFDWNYGQTQTVNIPPQLGGTVEVPDNWALLMQYRSRPGLFPGGNYHMESRVWNSSNIELDVPKEAANCEPTLLSVNTFGKGSFTVNGEGPHTSFSQEFQRNEVVEVAAVADEGWVFESWRGDEDTTEPALSVTMTRAKTLIANFVEEIVCFGDFFLETEAQLSSLAARNCTVLTGSLYVWDSQLQTLAGLETIREIQGDVYVLGGPNLISLRGLDGLTTIGGSLVLGANSTLTRLGSQEDQEGLHRLTSIAGHLDISQVALGNLQGLEQLADIGGRAQIAQNPNLVSLDGLSALVSVGGGFESRVWGMAIGANPALLDLSGLESLTSIHERLDVHDNDQLTSLAGLNRLSSVPTISVFNNPELTNLNALLSVAQLDGLLNIHNNDRLITLEGLNSLRVVGASVTIRENALLKNLDGLDALSTVGGAFKIEANPTLTGLGIPGLSDVGGDFVLSGTAASLLGGAFASLSHVGGNAFINDNPAMQYETIVSFVERIQIDGLIVINSVVYP